MPARDAGGRSRPRRRPPERAAGPALWLALLLLPLAGLAWAYVPLAPLTTRVPPPHRPPAREGLAWISTHDGRMVDDAGRTILLRGFNADTLLEPAARHSTLDERDAELMQRSGFDVVRLPLSWGLLEPQRGRIDTTYLDHIASTVAMLEGHRLHVVLAMHIRDWSQHYGGSGAPDWATAAVVPDLRFWPWESWRTHLNPAMNAATTYFWLSPDWQADYELVWTAIAGRFRDDSGVAGYDIYNEPHPLPIPPRIFDEQLMWPFYARMIDAIGRVDSNHLFLVEGIFFGDYGTAIRPLAAPDLVYAPHIYTGSLVPPAFDGDRGPLQRRIAAQAGEASLLPAVLWSGELGYDRSHPLGPQWADAVLDAFDDAGAGWAWWQWRESRAWGVVTADGAYVDRDWLRHLARPYLAAAPDGVTAGRGDGVRGSLSLHVARSHGGAEVEVSWPALTLGAPTWSGGCVETGSWDPLAARLSLSLAPGGSCTVHVAARP